MPCSRRPLMPRASASVSKCCENLKGPKRHEMAWDPIPRGTKLLEFYGFRRLFRPRHHVVDGGPDLGVAQRRVPALGRHRSRAPLYPVDGAGVESVAALGDVLGPLALIPQLRRAGDTSIVAGDARGLVDLLPVAGGWRRGRRVFYRLPLRFRRRDIDLGDGFDPLGRTRT